MQTGFGLQMRRSLPAGGCSFVAPLLRLVAAAAMSSRPRGQKKAPFISDAVFANDSSMTSV
jgi:hypothetical protein